MVLYLKALGKNCRDYLALASVVARFVEADVLLAGQLEEDVQTVSANLVVIEGLVAAGVTELKIPEIPQ